MEELHDLYSSRNIITFIKPRKMKWTAHVALTGERGGALRLWWGKLRVEGKRPLAKPRRRWESNIETDQDLGCGGIEWIRLAQVWDRWEATVNAVINLRVP